MAMLVSLTSFAAALGDGYEKVTNISTLAEGDKVVLYCDDSSIGVTGVNGTKDAAVAATGWVEYLVEAATGGVKLKDTSANKYVSLTTKNTFTYAASGSVCKVNATGVLGITLSGTDYFLYNNGGNYYRMYTDKTGNSSYKPFYVYKILAEGEVKAPIINGEVEFETSTTVSIEVSEGLKAYYTLDGTEPTTASTEYTAPFEVTETATVKAVAYDAVADQLSEVAVVDFKKLQVLTCADAVALCTETLSEDKYIIKGYVTSIESAYDASFNNVSFWLADTEDGGNVIQAYRAYPTTDTDKAVKVGDYVAIAGKLKLYNSTPEIENGTFTITEAPAPEPVMETVYFVNALSWTGTINAYAWDPVQNAGWPGVAATKEAEQIAGYDVYSYTAEAGTYKNIIFNGTGGQTADLVWTAGKYYVKDGWYTKEEAEAQLAKPVEYESVYFVDNQGWGKANIYTWSPEVGGWPGVPMTKEAEQLAGYDVYSYTVEKGTSFGGMLFNNANGVQTGDLKWTAGKYYVKDAWYTKEEAIEKLSAPVTPPVITYVLMGVKGDWTTGIAMTQNPDNANEYVLLGQEILEGDAVKVVTLSDGVATAWCGNVDEYSVAHSADDMGNIVLAPGKYDFYYKVAEDLIYIGGEAYKPEIEWIPMDLEITNLTTEVMEVEGAKYLQLAGRDDMNDADVMLFLNNYADVDDDYEVNAESSYMTFGGLELTVLEGVMTQTSETDKGTVYNGIVRTYVAEDSLYVAFNLTMYAAPATVLELTDAIVAINEELGTLTFNVPTGEGEGYFVELSGYTAPGVHEGPQICLFETPEVVAYTNYAETSVADGVITLKGEFTSFMGAKFDLTISGKLPVEEEPVKPEPTYTDNNLNPYAFGLTSKLSADKATLTVNYRLNNSKATDVDVVIYNGTEVVKVVAGTTELGKNTVEIPTADLPGGVELTWAVIVNGTSVEAPTQETKMYSMYCPHGLAIDKDPESENFGRILVADAMQVVKDKANYLGSGIGAGLHAFNPSFTTDSTVYTGGNDFTRIWADNGYQPWRVKISEDGRIFVSSLDLNGVVVWEVSKDLQTWTPVIAGTQGEDGNIYDADGNFVAGMNVSMDVKGSGEDLTLLLYSCTTKAAAFSQAAFRLDEYALGTATTWTGTPKNILTGGKYALVHTNAEWIYDGEGGYWFGGSRAGNAGQANLAHINAEGVEDYRSEDASLYGGDGVLLHDGMLIKGKARTSSTVGNIGFWTVSKDENGAPVLTEKWVVAANGIGRNLNEFAVDYANNLYAVGNSGEKIIAYALPYSGEVETPAASKYAFQLEGKTEVEYEVYEDEITNLVIDYDNMLLIGGPSANFEVDVYLGLGDYDRNTDKFALLPESSVAIRGIDATFVEGWASVDGIAQTANAVVRCVWNEMNIELHLAMSAATIEPTVVVVENAAIEVEKVLLFGDMYDYALKMTGTWTDAEGLNYPVLVEVPVYYPEATEPYEIYSTVTVGGWDDDENWLGFGEGYLTITQEGNTITAAGIVENAWVGIAIDITISGTITPTGLENATVTVKSVKMIKNGQLVIEKDGVQYNAQGAVVK